MWVIWGGAFSIRPLINSLLYFKMGSIINTPKSYQCQNWSPFRGLCFTHELFDWESVQLEFYSNHEHPIFVDTMISEIWQRCFWLRKSLASRVENAADFGINLELSLGSILYSNHQPKMKQFSYSESVT